MYKNGFVKILIIALIVIITGAVSVFLYQQRITEKQLSSNAIFETDDSQKPANKNSGAKLVYRVGKAKFNAGVGANCDETIELFNSSTPTSKLLDNCKAEVAVIGWMTPTKLLTWNMADKKTFSEFDIDSKTFKQLDVSIPPNNLNLGYLTYATSKAPKLIARLVKNEPKLLGEILKHDWRLADLWISDNETIFIVYSIEEGNPGFYVYSFNHSTGNLQSRFYLASYIGGDEQIYLLDDKKIIYSQPNQITGKQEIFTANLDGKNKEKLNDKISNIRFIGNGFVGSFIKSENQYKISIFNIEKNTYREIPFLLNSNGHAVDFAVLDFSRTSNKIAYKTSIFDVSCALYVFDIESEKNTKLADKCFINDVSWSE